MTKYIRYLLALVLLPLFSNAQVIISGNGEIVAKGTANIILAGDWTNNANNTGFTASSGTGAVVFKGSSAQISGGSKYTIYGNLAMNNSAGMSLGALTMIKNLSFSNGIITSTSTNALYISDGGSITGAGAGKFINGPMAKLGASDFKFEIGEGTRYAPIKMSGLSGAGSSSTVTAVYHYAAPSNKSNLNAPLTKVSDLEYWILDDPDGGGGFPPATYISAKIEIFWDNADASGIKSVNSDSLKFARLNGSNWNPEAATISGGTGSSSGSIGTTSNFDLDQINVTFGSTDNVANPLPIKLLSFTAQCREQDVLINWSTASEENNDYFTLLRSEDAEHFEEIAQISGAGNSNEVLNYSFTDWNAAGGNFYYMLKQTDYNGESETFEPIFVNCNQSKKVELKVLYDGEQAYAVLNNAQSGSLYYMMIIDYSGRVVVQQKQVVNTQNYYRIPSTQLASGIYSIIYFTDDGATQLNQKFFVR